MTHTEFENLQRGDVVQHIAVGTSYTIDYTIKDHEGMTIHYAVNVVQLSNPDEWKKVPRRKTRSAWKENEK